MTAFVEAIFVADRGAAPMRSVDDAKAIAGRGLAGDRYAEGLGSYSDNPKPGRDLTLIEAEVIELLRADGIDIEASEIRRNVLTRGVRLNDLVDKEFTVGDVRVLGIKLCEPCRPLCELLDKDILAPLTHKGGLNVQILEGGTIRVGDSIHTGGRSLRS